MKTISMVLDAVSINRAIRELESYKQWVTDRTNELRQAVAQELADNTHFSQCLITIWSYTPFGDGDKLALPQTYTPSVQMEVRDDGSVTTVFANGSDAIWCEFGTGVHYNGGAGASPHPLGEKLGYLIGGYGKGKGKQQTWAFKDGQLYFTHGIPAYMPMYNAWQLVVSRLYDIAREVFA